MTHPTQKGRLWAVVTAAALTLLALSIAPPPLVHAATPSIAVAQYPLTVAVPAHPQVLFAVGNSQSMDGDLSGAIYTGAGAIAYTALNASSSPVNYTVPTDFTAPVSGTAAGGSAPYTVTTSGVQYDNSASRLNVAKAGIASILQNFLADADFGLIDYKTSGLGAYTTWVYYMSPSGGFTFTNTANASTVANPCYGITSTSTTVYSDCSALNTHYGMNISTYQFIQTASTDGSSDDPDISDVLYAGGLPPVFLTYSGPSPADPYTAYSLSTYNSGGVSECYSSSTPSVGGICETPTNAGFVPWSTEVLNVERGFGFYTSGETAAPASTNPTNWQPLVTMTSAGQVPTASSIATAAAAFAPYLKPETNSTGTTEIKAVATQSPIAGLLKAAGLYYTQKNPASTNGCSPNRYIVLVTDGLPTLDLNGKAWPPLGSAAAAGYGEYATFNADGSLSTGNTNDQALIDTINTLNALSTAASPIKTYVIGLGAGVDNPSSAAGQTLTAMAMAGGTNTYFSAQNVQQLDDDMQVILAQILAQTSATSAAAVNSTGISTTSVAYQGTFTTSDTYQDWTGNLLAYPINASTGQINTAYSNAIWQAQVQLDAQNWDSTGRRIATWDPVTGSGIPFEWDTSTTATSGIASSTALGAALETYSGDTNGQDVLQYLRGDSSKEQRNGGTLRNRSHKLGDIVDSSPLYIAQPSGPWQQSSYLSFEATYAHRTPMVYIGANDGMLHAFNASTGNEVFAFIPHAVFSNLTRLANPYYNSQHQFFVDGSPEAADVTFADGTWHTVLFGSERGGGSSIFAIDITDPSSFTSESAVASKVLWEFTDPDLGLTYSNPVAVNTAAGFMVMFGNGYNSTQGKPFLYALNPQTGAVEAKIDLCAAVAASLPSACDATKPNGLSSIVSMNSSGALLSGTANVIYAGDLQGNLWRVNIADANPADWTVSILFQATDGAGNRQPITVTPAVTLNPLVPTLAGTMVYFGTGQLLSVADLSNTSVQSIYGVYDSGSASGTPLTRSDLVAQTMTTATVTTTAGFTTTIRLLTNNAVNLPSVKGWYVDLTPNGAQLGERDVTDPALFNGTLQVTTYQPNASTCTGGGQAYYTVFNYQTGGATTVSQFDWNGQSSITSADLYMGQIVSGESLGSAYAAAPKMVTTSGGGAVVYTTSGGAEIVGGGGGTPGTCTSVPGTSSCIPGTPNADTISHGAWQEVQ